MQTWMHATGKSARSMINQHAWRQDDHDDDKRHNTSICLYTRQGASAGRSPSETHKREPRLSAEAPQRHIKESQDSLANSHHLQKDQHLITEQFLVIDAQLHVQCTSNINANCPLLSHLGVWAQLIDEVAQWLEFFLIYQLEATGEIDKVLETGVDVRFLKWAWNKQEREE